MKHIAECLKEAASINVWSADNLIISLLLLLGLSGCQSEPPQEQPMYYDPATARFRSASGYELDLPLPSLPDLSGCTRIEIVYFPSTLKYFFPGSSHGLSQEELEYLETIKVVVIDDEETIEDFAHDVGRSVYRGQAIHGLAAANIAGFKCFCGNEQISNFHMIAGLIQTSDGNAFEFKSERTDWGKMCPPGKGRGDANLL